MTASINFQIISDYQVIRVSGQDSEKFLQGQLTCDLSEADGTRAVIGGYCNVQGRLHATFYLLKSNDDYLLITPKGVAEHLLTTLSKYAVFFQTQLNIEKNLVLIAQTHNSTFKRLAQSSQPCGEQLYLGKLTINIVHQDFLQEIIADATESELDIFALEQISSAIPMITENTLESLLPHYIGLPQIGGVNFEKGCYTGQEVVARMHYRGTLKTHPHKVEIEAKELISSGAEVVNSDGKKVGELINIAFNGEKLLGIISLSDKALNTLLEIKGKTVRLLDADN